MTSAALHREWSLKPGDTAAVPGLRHRIMNALRRQTTRDADLWSAEIVVGELLSNSVVHTRGIATVILSWDGDHPMLSITDIGHAADRPDSATAVTPLPQFPGRLPGDALAEGGRGLYLVSSLALDVQVAARARGGSRVSVLLDVAHSA
jgi:anti-sigma regulatory factor (Ser/Thr protein kinase)